MSPLFRSRPREHPAVPDDPLAWRPQLPRPTDRPPAIADPIIEPLWSGRHVLAHFDAALSGAAGRASLRLIDVDGDEATDEEPEVVEELAVSVLATDAVLDGYLTDQATLTGEGASLALRARVSALQPLVRGSGDLEVGVRPEDVDPGIVAFVAVDLLRVDGESLLDVPLLERKRLLEGVVAAGELVRVSPYTRPPLRQWLASWKSAGFEGAVMKAANSRYQPMSLTDEWTVFTKLR